MLEKGQHGWRRERERRQEMGAAGGGKSCRGEEKEGLTRAAPAPDRILLPGFNMTFFFFFLKK